MTTMIALLVLASSEIQLQEYPQTAAPVYVEFCGEPIAING